MKKLLFSLTLLLCIVGPAIAQGDTEEAPNEVFVLKKGNIPPQIIKAAQTLFSGSTQVEWGVFPYELKDYGWVVNKQYNEPIDHYELHLKMSDGSDAFAVFESTGELIAARMVRKNAPVPPEIIKAIETGPYKDWKISGDIAIIKNTQKKVVDHYDIKVEKGGKTKHLYFTTRGVPLENK